MSVLVPLHSREGVVAHASIDAADAALVGAYRWHLLPKGGYVTTGIPRPGGGQRTLYLHRLLLGLDFGDKRQGDHKNFDKLDNRRSNLRIATRLQNTEHVPSRGGTSAYRGVAFDKRKECWRAYVFLGGRQAFHAYFDSELDAARAASRFRAEHMPFSIEDPALLGAAA